MSEELKQEVLEALKRFNTCVIATVTEDSRPEAAIVGFSSDDEFGLVVGTSNRTRKYANLSKNPHVAIAIGDKEVELQYEGVVSPLETEVDSDWLQEHIRQVPAAKFYYDDPNQVWFKVKPVWIKLSVHGAENRIEEVSFA